MGLATAMNLGADQPDKATARIGILMSLAIFSAPLMLGGLADRIGLKTAYSAVGVLLVITLGAALYAHRFNRQSRTESKPATM